jgi:glycosyltransferase involved in cell wall biosynthesis
MAKCVENQMPDEVELSIVIPVSERLNNIEELYREYKVAVAEAVTRFEFIYVLDGGFSDAAAKLEDLQKSGEPIIVVQLAKYFGQATAMTAGFDMAKADMVLTLPSFFQLSSSDIPKLIRASADADVVLAVRLDNDASKSTRVQRRLFNSTVSKLTGMPFRDLGCGARVLRREVFEEIRSYGDQHRFMPLLASRAGFRVLEVEVTSSRRDSRPKYYHPGIYARRALDIVTVFFLIKFTQKPLRFFGLIGSAVATVGGFVTLFLIAQRLFGETALADRHAFLLGVLFVVLGVQLFAIGLLGELIIFTRAKQSKEYRIERTINM